MTIPHLRGKCNAPHVPPPPPRRQPGAPASSPALGCAPSKVGRRCVGVAHPLADRDGAGLDGVSPHQRLPRPRRSAALPTAPASRRTPYASRFTRHLPRASVWSAAACCRFPAPGGTAYKAVVGGNLPRPGAPASSPALGCSPSKVGRRCAGVAHPLADRDGAGLDGVSPHRRLPRPRRSAALPFRAVPRRADRPGAGRCARAGQRSPPVSRRNRSPAAIWGQCPDG